MEKRITLTAIHSFLIGLPLMVLLVLLHPTTQLAYQEYTRPNVLFMDHLMEVLKYSVTFMDVSVVMMLAFNKMKKFLGMQS